jgi:hypothetical protein
MNLSTGPSPMPAAAQTRSCAGHQIHLGSTTVSLDRGGVQVALWPDSASLERQVTDLCDLASPVVRLAGGALLNDLSLQDNLMLEPALHDGAIPAWLLPEIDSLFAQAGCAVDWPGWAATFPGNATEAAFMQVRTGRALVADPDVLLLDAAQWNDDCIHPLAFSRSFASRYPWRMLVWVTADTARAAALRTSLEEFTA